MKKLHVLFLLIITLLVGCDTETINPNDTMASNIQVNDAYIRAMPPSAPSSAAFMTINNTGENDTKLVEVTSNVAKSVELHQHQHVDGMMKMRRVDSILISAKGQEKLQPGGYHIMLIGLQTDLKINKPTEFTLTFDDGSTHTLSVPVKKISEH